MPSVAKRKPASAKSQSRRPRDKDGRAAGRHPGYLAAKSRSHVTFPLAIPNLLNFLRKVHTFPSLYLNRAVLKEAVRRYEFFWIPLLASVDHDLALQLVPPLDVEWVHHCHMLSPHRYRRDMVAIVPSSARLENMFARTLLSDANRDAARKTSSALWALHSTGEPYDVERMLANAPVEASPNDDQQLYVDTRLNFDFFEAAKRQIALHYQVAVMPQYEDTDFIELAVYQYLDCFLRLKKEFPDKKMVPSRAISVAWVTHILHPGLYHDETSALFGEMLPYDGDLDAALTGTDLMLALKDTQLAWAQVFNERGPSTYGELWRGTMTPAELKVRPLLSKIIASYEEAWAHQKIGSLRAVDSMPGSEASLLGSDQLGINWVHTQSLKNCQIASGGVLHRVSGVSEKYTDLLMEGRNERIVPVLCSHAVYGLGMTERPGLVLLAQLGYVEIYSGGAADLSDADVPLASAERLHYALPKPSKYSNRREPWHHEEGDECVLLRVGGEDVAILKFKPTGEITSLKDRLSRSRRLTGVRRQYDMFFCPLQGKHRGKGMFVRLANMRGKVSEVTKVAGNGMGASDMGKNETFTLSKRSPKFSEWDIECSSSKTVLISFLISMAESMIEAGNEQYTRECCRRKADTYEMGSHGSAANLSGFKQEVL